MLAGLQGKPVAFPGVYRREFTEAIDLADWTARWDRTRKQAEEATNLTGKRSLRLALDRLDAEWTALVQSESVRAASETEPDAGGAVPTGKERQPRLRIMRGKKAAVVDGEMRNLPPQPLQLLSTLAKAALLGSDFVPTPEIEAQLWGSGISKVSRPLSDVTRDLRDALSESDEARGTAWQLIETKRGVGIRLALPSEEIQTED
jgi:DNA-binding response OmpR family regulator